MAQSVASDEIEAQHVELPELGRSLATSFQQCFSNSQNSLTSSSVEDDANDECTLLWAEIERLPTFERLRSSLFNEFDGHSADAKRKQVIDVTKLGALERHTFMGKLIKHVENDNLRLLQKLRRRIDKVGMRLPTVEVRYKSLHVAAECEVIRGKPLPTLWNSLRGMLSGIVKLPGVKSKEAKISIINDVSGIIKPGRLTLLLGPPGCGKTSLLKALSGNLNKSLKVSGEVSYNGYNVKEFVPQKISAYHADRVLDAEQFKISLFQEIMTEVSRREKEARIVPDPDLDTYMKAISVEGQRTTLQTDYILKILGLDICADTLCGDAMRRGISGGQKKRLTTARAAATARYSASVEDRDTERCFLEHHEMGIVGPINAFFMDEISSGLDSSTTDQIVTCLQQLAHFTDATILVSLLQPAPETFDLFDDIILMGEGKIVYQGPRIHVLEFFESSGFRCPERKGIADFLQEVISIKDQAQYWHRVGQSHSYVSNDMLCRSFKESPFGKKLDEEICEDFVKSESHENTIAYSTYSISKWELFRACMSREFLLMQRNSFVYVFRLCQFVLLAFITMTVFLRSRMDVDVVHANYYLGSLFFTLVIFLVDGFPELSMTVARLPITPNTTDSSQGTRSPTPLLKRGDLRHRLTRKLFDTPNANLTREVQELKGVVTTLQKKLEAVAPTISTNQTHLDPSDLRLRLTSRSGYGRSHKSETDPSYQPRHVDRSESYLRREKSIEDSTNLPPAASDKIRGRRSTGQKHCPQGRVHPPGRKVRPQGRTSRKPTSGTCPEEYTPPRDDSGYPLSKGIEKAKLPPNFRMPQCDLYDGNGDPGEHVYQFQTNMLLLQVSDAVMCRAFPTTLRKAAHAWFKSLRPRSIHSFAQLSDSFQKHFVSSRTRRKNSASLLNVVQERNESLSRYLGRFNAATLEIDNLDESVKYTAFMRGLRPTTKFAFAVNKSPPGNMSDLLEKANKYIQAEEYLETHKEHRGDNEQG
ncbi:hypothetical protein RJ639_026150 [Escallonia herrerae]|uniref:ABC transporter domain-containing protein n=1 Tax=Escallonia herrerae TaxID=1293975 RepID=A0AA88UY54_9ASTE|nr:hypothetical protein RJ639_026150 [Escallonia herrerae]